MGTCYYITLIIFLFGVCLVVASRGCFARVKRSVAGHLLSCLAPVLLLLASVSSSAQVPLAPQDKSLADRRPLELLVSVRPLALIAQEVLGERGNISVLVAAGQSPHNFSLKASDRIRIENADLVLWVGPELERFLVKPLRAANNAMTFTGQAQGPDSDHDIQEEQRQHESHTDAHQHSGNSHPWLAPDVAMAQAVALADQLAELDPKSAAFYRNNARDFVAQISALDKRLKQSLPAAGPVYAVAHDAYGSFSEHYQLPEPIVLSVSPEVSPGARKLWQLKSQLAPQSCVLVELEHQSRWVKALVETQQLRLLTVDTLAYSTDVGSYSDFLQTLSGVFRECLK